MVNKAMEQRFYCCPSSWSPWGLQSTFADLIFERQWTLELFNWNNGQTSSH